MKIRTKLIVKYLLLTTLLVAGVFILLEELLFPTEGYDMLYILGIKLAVTWLILSAIVFVIAYFMARGALKPISKIVKRVENITASNLNERIEIDNVKDEINDLAVIFNNMLDRLGKSFEAQKMYVNHVSHDLRTPVGTLIAELELSLHRERTPEEYQKAIENSLVYAHDLEKLLTGLTDLAKASYHANQIKKSSVRLDELLFDVSIVVMKAHKDYHVELFFDEETDDDRMISVHGNEYLLGTAFINLMENNCKFSHNHTSTVRISSLDGKIFVRFSDTGIGISEEDLERLFKPFHRGENHYFASGNGIGMALVNRIVKLHSGSISVNSIRDRGTTFLLEFEHI